MLIGFFYRDRGGKIWHNHQPKRRLPKSLMISSCIASHYTSRTIKLSEDRLHKVLSKISTHSPIIFICVFGFQVNTHQFIIPSAPTMLKTGVGKRRDLTDTALYQEVSHE